MFSLSITYCTFCLFCSVYYWIGLLMSGRQHANCPKNKHRCWNPFMWFICNLQRQKICTVLYCNIRKKIFTSRLPKCKNPLPGLVAISTSCKPRSTLDLCWKLTAHVEIWLPHFPQAVGLTPSSNPTLSAWSTHACDTILTKEPNRRRHQHIRHLLHTIQ